MVGSYVYKMEGRVRKRGILPDEEPTSDEMKESKSRRAKDQ